MREAKRSPAFAARATAAVREFFADTKVERADYEHLVATMPGSDPDDHEHMAAAVARQPCTILTRDTSGFPSRPLQHRGVRVTDPDTYLCELADELPDELADTIVRLAAETRRPPRPPASSWTTSPVLAFRGSPT